MEHEVSSAAALFADPARAAIVVSLLGGRALPAGELARAAGISAQSASNHLALLRDNDILEVEQQGKHRYYRLHRADVASAVEALATLAPRPQQKSALQQSKTGITFARHCYSHLAGWLAVQVFERMNEEALVRAYGEKGVEVTVEGRAWFEGLGIDAAIWRTDRERLAVRCLDWTERKHHLAGRLGVAFFHLIGERGWIKPMRESRAVRVTDLGRREFEALLGIAIPRSL